ncbi:hypothetical protein LJC63_02005 [Ruminococcaceae bacterium OttesenSCG-928-L11]|nr:hypothetical protein [Ruminococcaceae bacterium OttesenSCG-928-L11]
MYEILVRQMDDGDLTYLADGLELPASQEDIERVMELAGVDKPYIAHSYSFRLNELNGQITGPQPLEELNSFAAMIACLSEYERVKLEGAVLLTNCKTPADCAKLLCNLDSFALTPNVGDYESLGRYFAANDFADSLSKCPLELMMFFDYELLGNLGWDDSTSAFIKGHHIRDTEQPLHEFDPEINLLATCMAIRLCSDRNTDGVWLKFPLQGEDVGYPLRSPELEVALASLQAASITECHAVECVSEYPCLEQCLDTHAAEPLDQLLWKAHNLSLGEMELSQYGKEAYAKFAAALEYENCADLDLAADISQNLRCYDFAKNAEDYAQKYLAAKGIDDPILTGCFDLKALGDALISQNGATMTGAGIIFRNENEFIYDYYTPQEKGIRLFCPLEIKADPDSEFGEEYGDVVNEYDYATIPNYVARSYMNEINAAIAKEALPEEDGKGLAKYLDSAALAAKVSYIWPSVEIWEDKLWGVIDVKLVRDLSSAEMTELTDYCAGQMADGWGEGFEQRPVKTSEGDLYVSFWQSGNSYFLKPEDELKQTGRGHTMQMDM